MPDLTLIATVTIFIATYAVVAVGKVPVYRIDRAGAALLGGSLMLAIGVLTPQEAYRAIDFDTITLLLGMMIVVANLRVCGFFRLVTDWIATHVRRPLALLVAIALASGTLSAFLVNDTICLVMTPLVLELVTAVRRNPIPYLLAVATASNIGSVASLSQIPYGVFAGKLAPVAAIGLVITVLLIALVHRGEFFTSERLEKAAMPTHHHGPLMTKTLIVMTVMIVLFFLGQPAAKVAIVGGAFLLFTRRVRPQKIYIEIDWPLFVMFVGLFVVVAGLEKMVLTPEVTAAAGHLRLDNSAVLAAITAVLSNIVSNVPAVLLLKPFVPNLEDAQRAWLIIAMAATFAGNFTLVGSVANLVVAQRAKARGVEIGFWAYFRVGAPLSLITIVIGLLLL